MSWEEETEGIRRKAVVKGEKKMNWEEEDGG